MAREKRRVSTFSLSFLDIMACGFGAVTLLFLILKHDADTVRGASYTGAATESESTQMVVPTICCVISISVSRSS